MNAEGARHVVEALPRSAALVYVSTDFVFSGRKKTPYAENDKPAPLSVYGKTKRQGELHALRHPRAYVVRSSWLYGLHGRHFVQAILAKAEAGEALRVVRDQVGAPTFAFDLAQQIKVLLEREISPGVYHVTNSGACSRCEFAKAILGEYNNGNVRVTGIRSAQMPRPAKRPLNSRLSNEKLRRTGVPLLRHWRAALRHYCRLTAWR
jgi:dTDP-4-dehydrorhamnose reductase